MPARKEEVHHAEDEGVRFELLTAPVEVLGDEKRWVTGLKCVEMELGEPDDTGRRRPVQIAGSRVHVIDCDLVVVAIGTRANPLLTGSAPELKVNGWGYSRGRDGMTSMPGVFAGGDIVRGAATVILAMGDGKDSAGDRQLAARRLAAGRRERRGRGRQAGPGKAEPVAGGGRAGRPPGPRGPRRSSTRRASRERRRTPHAVRAVVISAPAPPARDGTARRSSPRDRRRRSTTAPPRNLIGEADRAGPAVAA